jgi:hypothetical protein
MSPLVLQIGGGILAVGFIFLLVMCWKTWRITHILFAFCVFAAAVTFLAFASAVIKTQSTWRSLYESYTVAVRQAQRKGETLQYGDPSQPSAPMDSVRGARAELFLREREVGRSWRGCRPVAAIDDETVRVSTVAAAAPLGQPPVAAPAGDAPAEAPKPEAPRPNGIVTKMVLYVFAEKNLVPSLYLGKFVVKEATDTQVSLSPLLPLHPERDREQLDSIRQSVSQPGTITWSLYELMPIDGHDFFARWDDESKMMVGLERDELTKLFPNLFNWPQAQYDRFLDQYQRLNRPAKDEDPAENKWVQVKFLQSYEIPVDSDAAQSLMDPSARPFDTSGRAVEPGLRRGAEGPVKFQPGDVAVFDQQTADKLISAGNCEKVKVLYRRSLHNYEQTFAEAWFQHVDLDQRIARASRDAKSMTELQKKAETQEAFHRAEKAKLGEDLRNFKTELNEVTNYQQALLVAWLQSRERLSELYRTNLQLAEELKRLQFQMAEEINKHTAEATARMSASPP